MRFLWKAGLPAVVSLTIIICGCGDAYRPIANPVIQPGGDPQNFDAVYTINQNVAGVAGTLTEINVSGDSVTGNRPVGTDPSFVTFDVAGASAYIANRGSDNITGNSPTSSSEITISLDAGANPVALNSNRSGLLLVANSRPIATSACPGSGTIGFIDTVNAVLTGNACVGPSPSFVIDAGGSNRKAFVLDAADNVVRVVGLDAVAQIGNQPTVGANPAWAAMSTDGTQVYVSNQGSSTISVIDVVTQTVVGTIPTGAGPTFLAVDKALNRVYVANTAANSVSIYDASQSPMALLRTVAVGPSPRAIAVLGDGSRAYVANTGSATITEINSASFQTKSINVVDTAAVPGATVTWVARSQKGTKVYATYVEPTNLKNGTAVIATSNDQVVVNLPAPTRDITCDQSQATCPKERQRPIMLASR